LVEIRNLEVRRGRFALTVPEWTVAPGEVAGLVGPNGAGKTTLLEVLAGFRPAGRGEARVAGVDPWREPVAARLAMGFMNDEMPLFDMRIGPLCELLSGYYSTWDGELVNQLLNRFKLDPRHKARSLSRGEGTRLRLVLALAFRPRLLILDEPAAGLDLGGRRALLGSVLEVAGDPQRSVIVSSHMLADVERIADKLLVLHEGRVVQQGRTDELVGDGRTLEEALVAWGAAG